MSPAGQAPDAAVSDPESLGAGVRVAGEALGWLVDAVHGVHRAVAARVLGAAGRSALPVRLVHDPALELTYGAVRTGLAVGTEVAAEAARRRRPGPATVRRSASVLAATSGIVGDAASAVAPHRELGISLRAPGGRPLSPAAAARQHAGTERDHLVVLVHGLCETEAAWWHRGRFHRATGAPARSLGEELDAAAGTTSLYVRYDTGAAVADSGQRLDALLDELVGSWPVPVRTVSLVGHSMGGLVIGAARDAGAARRAEWTRRLAHLVHLGTPHLGAPLAKAVHAGARLLRRAPETRPVADLLDRRSPGVRDLRTGPRPAADRGPTLADAALAGRVSEHAIVARLDRRGPLGWALGDGMVRPSSGLGRSAARAEARFEHEVSLPGRDHFDLLTDPDVVAHVRAWLASDEAARA